MRRSPQCFPELQARAGRMVLDTRNQHLSPSAAIGSIAGSMDRTAGTLRQWMCQLRKTGQVLPLASARCAQARLAPHRSVNAFIRAHGLADAVGPVGSALRAQQRRRHKAARRDPRRMARATMLPSVAGFVVLHPPCSRPPWALA